MSVAPAPASVIREAVTVVLQHAGDTFMIRRQPALPSFPGYWAFPGGKVDLADAQAPARRHDLFKTYEPRLMQALARELQEEIQFDLDAAVDAGEVLALHLFGTALTPPIIPVRFNTLFFRVELKSRPHLELDTGEVDDCNWLSAGEWMARYRRGHLLLAPPTLASLELFESGGGLTEEERPLEEFHKQRLPVIESIRGLRMIPVRSNTLPPAAHTNCFILGDEGSPRLMIDPSPNSVDECEALIERAQAFGIDEIFLTHHHPDHCERADEIARRLGAGLAMSTDTESRIRAALPGFFSGLRLRRVGDGDQATRWLGQPVQVLAVPGHDEGQLALMPEDRSWCIVGDLIQGIGTVVIHKPEGNMGRYFASLQRIIDLDPKIIIPSHGLPMGSTYRLRATLRHRQEREAAVLQLYQAGNTVEQMLETLYRDVDKRLWPLALQNIECHLDKLREEGRLAAVSPTVQA